MLRKAIISAIILILAVTVWGAAGPLSASKPASADATVPPNANFGLCFVSSAEYPADEARYQRGVSTGATWTRWPLYWRNIEKSPGTFDYSAHDPVVAADVAYGFQTDAILLGTPNFYATGGSPHIPAPRVEQKNLPHQVAGFSWKMGVSSASSTPQNLYQPVFDDGTDVLGPGKGINPDNYWARFVSDIVARYKPGGWLANQEGWPEGAGVSHWEMWNEPDFSFFWSGTVEEYFRLLKVGYLAAKFADPDCTVLVGGLANYFDASWFPRLLDAIGEDPDRAVNNWYFDVAATHSYSRPRDTYEHTQRIGDLLRPRGLGNKPIWVNESGVPVWDDYPGPTWEPTSPYRATMEEQAAYVIQDYAYGLYTGAERVFHFMLHDDCGNGPDAHDAYGLFRNTEDSPCYPSDGRARPSYTAYQVAATHLRDVEHLWRGTPGGQQEQIAFYRPATRERVMVLWATQGVTVTAQVSAAGDEGLLVDQAGITQTIAPIAGVYTVALPAATNQNHPFLPPDEYMIGGRPYLLVERDTQPPTSTVESLPPSSAPAFVVRWKGHDLGSGVASYDVWFNDGDSPLQVWMTNTTVTSATFSGVVGHTYGFAVRARDQAGNEEPIPTAPQASTLVVSSVPVSGTVIDADGGMVIGATVTISGANTLDDVTSGEGGLWSATLSEGEYAFYASAPGYGTWPAPRHVTVGDSTHITLTLAPPVNAVIAGDFEGPDVWDAWARPNGEVSLSTEAFDGQAAALLGSGAGWPVPCHQNDQPGELWTLKQTVSVPQGYQSTLSFLSAISTTQTDFDYAWLEVVILDDGQPYYLVPWGELWRASDWTLTSLDLSSWQGRTVDLLFQVVHCSDQSFTATLDRVGVGSARLPYRVFLPLTMR
jgi:hypothetical protein